MAEKAEADRFKGASIHHATGQVQKVEEIKRVTAMSPRKLKEVLEGLELIPADAHMALSEHVRLSARQAWVEGRGWLKAMKVNGFYPESPAMWWSSETSSGVDQLEIWLKHLTPDTLYIAQLEVSSMGSGKFEITTAMLETFYQQVSIDAQGAGLTLLTLFNSGSEGSGRILVKYSGTYGWGLYEVAVSAASPS